MSNLRLTEREVLDYLSRASDETCAKVIRVAQQRVKHMESQRELPAERHGVKVGIKVRIKSTCPIAGLRQRQGEVCKLTNGKMVILDAYDLAPQVSL
jgi:hypothetical protein